MRQKRFVIVDPDIKAWVIQGINDPNEKITYETSHPYIPNGTFRYPLVFTEEDMAKRVRRQTGMEEFADVKRYSLGDFDSNYFILDGFYVCLRGCGWQEEQDILFP